MDLYPEKKPKSLLLDLAEVVLLALALYIIIQFAVQTIHVIGPSMENTLMDNDFLIASKVDYHLHAPQRGDIVIFKPTNEAAQDYVKRIIALPGEHLRISHAQVFVNGHLLKEPYLPEAWTYIDTWNDGQESTVPADSYFVMGDNRNHSTDSRALGFQKRDAFLGRAWIRIWPLSTIRIFSGQSDFAN